MHAQIDVSDNFRSGADEQLDGVSLYGSASGMGLGGYACGFSTFKEVWRTLFHVILKINNLVLVQFQQTN